MRERASLRAAIDTRDVIGQAKGILMERFKTERGDRSRCVRGGGGYSTTMTSPPDPDMTTSEQLDEDELGTDPLEAGADPPEHWSGADRTGTTQREQREGAPLAERLAEEEPDQQP